MRILFAAICLFTAAAASFGDTIAVAARIVDKNAQYYPALHEAFEAAAGTFDFPDEITLLGDITVYAPLIIKDGQHIRLVPGNGKRTIMRGDDLLDYPVIWVSGENASLSLGQPSGMEHELIIDGGYLNTPPVIANTPLAAVNGPGSKLIMYNNVTLQNNYNFGSPPDTSLYENGAGVFIRTAKDETDRLAEFIMKGGVIQGNINNIQSSVNIGGGITMTGFGLFTMEGGVIQNNTAYRSGGGVALGSRASFIKTGGIVYGKNAPVGLRNNALNIAKTPTIGHAVVVFIPAISRFRNDTVKENDSLSYIGHPFVQGVFGKGEKWDSYKKMIQRRIALISILPVLVLNLIVFLLIKKNMQKTLSEQAGFDKLDIELTEQEKKVLELLMTDLPVKVIADNLHITYDGVMFHSRKIYKKLNVHNRTELLAKYEKSMSS